MLDLLEAMLIVFGLTFGTTGVAAYVTRKEN